VSLLKWCGEGRGIGAVLLSDTALSGRWSGEDDQAHGRSGAKLAVEPRPLIKPDFRVDLFAYRRQSERHTRSTLNVESSG
jgi:hypothetical protein